MRRKAVTKKGKPIAESTAPKRNPFKVSRVIADKFDWKHKVDSPVVEDAIDHFTKFMCRNGFEVNCGSSEVEQKMQASRARLFKEYKEVQREKVADPDIQLVCDDSNIFKWTALIKGPSETPFDGGVFQLAFSVPEQYPLQPPQVRFLTKIFHPNVHFKTGEICLDILKNAWSPAWTLQSVCRAIIALMAHPEPDSPLNCDSGNLLRSGDIRGYQSMAKMYTRLAAMPKKG
ncbi:protein PEROXIN-4 [Forsythia ovata]|uniref:E2 ubiquitin-conjugating enzyme n=1 Tax=Forsythia ovata TaxID=205694 RepID=A0ABD1X4U3_9LAMI